MADALGRPTYARRYTFCDKSFAAPGPRVWNNLSSYWRQDVSTGQYSHANGKQFCLGLTDHAVHREWLLICALEILLLTYLLTYLLTQPEPLSAGGASLCETISVKQSSCCSTETRDDSAHFQETTEGLSVPHLMCWRTEGTFTTARCCCDVFVILAPDIKLQTYLLSYHYYYHPTTTTTTTTTPPLLLPAHHHYHYYYYSTVITCHQCLLLT